MSTTKTRINISVPKEVERALIALARRDAVPLATKAREVLEGGLELEEDMAIVDIIKKREKEGKFISHEEVWKRYTR